MSKDKKSNEPDRVEIPDTEVLKQSHDDAKSAIERGMNKHGKHASKAIKMVQLNRLVISVFVAGTSQIDLSNFAQILMYVGGVFFFASSLFALRAYKTQSLPIGISPTDIDTVNNNNLSEDQYLHWYTTEYYPETISQIIEKAGIRADNIEYSIYAFFAGLLTISVGIIIQLAIL